MEHHLCYVEEFCLAVFIEAISRMRIVEQVLLSGLYRSSSIYPAFKSI